MPVNTHCAMAKMYCAQSACEVADDAMQIFGGIGITMDCRIQRIWRDLRIYRIGGGTDEVMVGIIGKSILKQYAK
jgi:alkylation response protein AidB-like acyl-CoA dehydrogenase